MNSQLLRESKALSQKCAELERELRITKFDLQECDDLLRRIDCLLRDVEYTGQYDEGIKVLLKMAGINKE